MAQIKISEKDGAEPTIKVSAPTIEGAFEILVLKGILDPYRLLKKLKLHHTG